MLRLLEGARHYDGKGTMEFLRQRNPSQQLPPWKCGNRPPRDKAYSQAEGDKVNDKIKVVRLHHRLDVSPRSLSHLRIAAAV